MSDDSPAFQDSYPDDVAHCYGCGRLNEHGLQLKSRWDGEETIARFTPRPYHTAIPGYVYGGLIASLIDCHGTGTASAAHARAYGSDAPRFVTAQLTVDFLRPTPIGVPLEVRGRIEAIKERKVIVTATVSAHGEPTARGRIVCVLMPASMAAKPAA